MEAVLEKQAADEEIKNSIDKIGKAKEAIEKATTVEEKKAGIKELKIADADKREATDVANSAELKIKKAQENQ
jgi:hypothetical protein